MLKEGPLRVDEGTATHLAEFEALRREMEMRMTANNGFIALVLAAIGTGLSISAQFPQALVGVAAIASLLWGIILDNGNRVQQMGMYIALELRPQLLEKSGHTVLAWELFHRRVAVVTPQEVVDAVGKVAKHSHYVTVLFCLTPPLLLSLFASKFIQSGHSRDWQAWAEVLAVTILWAISVRHCIHSMRMTKTIARTVAERGTLTGVGIAVVRAADGDLTNSAVHVHTLPANAALTKGVRPSR